MKVRYRKGVATHLGPESCGGVREDDFEALTGETAGQPLSRERMFSRVSTLSTERKTTRADAQTRAFVRPGVVVDPGMYGSSLHGNREISGLAMTYYGGHGPQREGEEP